MAVLCRGCVVAAALCALRAPALNETHAGGPIIIFTPGESNFQGYSGYLSNGTIPGRIAQENGGATIVVEVCSSLLL